MGLLAPKADAPHGRKWSALVGYRLARTDCCGLPRPVSKRNVQNMPKVLVGADRIATANVVEPLQIFISSPGDVQPERVVAQRIIDRLAREFANHFDISAIRWERNPMRATEHFQAQIPRASNAHIVVVIVLWSAIICAAGTSTSDACKRGPTLA